MKSSVLDLKTISTNVRREAEAAVNQGNGVLRLAPAWVPRSFLHPGLRIKLHPQDTYAYGLSRGGIDERWFASTTEAANEGRLPDEGLSYVVFRDKRFLLRDAVNELGALAVGKKIWAKYRRWPVYSKFFDNMGPIPHHLHQSEEMAKLVGQEGKPEIYYFPPQHNATGNNFPYTFFGLLPGTTKAQVRKCLEDWHKGDNGILDISQAYRLKPGTGWHVPPGVLHAPGSLCTYEPQWGSDVFGMYQSLVEGREVPWSLLVKDVPEDKAFDLDFIISEIDWDLNVDPDFHKNHYLAPLPAGGSVADGYLDKWICYGRFKGWQAVTAKELTVLPGAKVTVKDNGAYGLITVQGEGKINGQRLSSPNLIRFHELTEDECFVVDGAARAGVVFENTSKTEPMVMLRYFGPEVNPNAPDIGGKK
ncbi:MAG: hypothetical protein FWH21_08320 [Kiritimatiellaeota bacterium]|nr:hypothetical protein [Kiritimatiellota bacterium]